MAITSDEVNFLIYRYLQESGFLHSAFTFAYESQLATSNVISTDVPPGALISFVQKGLQYVGIEAHINEDGTERECEGEISLLSPHICRVAQSACSSAQSSGAKSSNKRKRKAGEASPDGVEMPKAEANGVAKLDHTSLVLLSGHEKEVYGCSWHPSRSVLVSGSSDSTARIWDIPSDFATSKAASEPVHVLNHGTGPHKDVTTIEWNHDGSLLATGTYNGKTRIWTADGEMKQLLQYHQGPVFATRWSPSSTYLLSSSFDKTVVIWDTASEKKRQQIKLHDDPILDASWKDDHTYATCSSDMKICVVRVDQTQPDAVLTGHKDSINSVRWDPSGRLLASCSDDYTVKIWSPSDARKAASVDVDMEAQSTETAESSASAAGKAAETTESAKIATQSSWQHNFQEHTKEVYTFRWSPCGAGSDVPNGTLSLASASFDATVKLWDIETGVCTRTFDHQDPVYGVAYSPNGEYLASGTIGGFISIWSLKDGSLIKTCQANGDIYEVGWNREGTLVAASVASGDVALINFRM